MDTGCRPRIEFFLVIFVYITYCRNVALNIKDPEADRLVRELVAVTGESITEAARTAFAERLQRIRARIAAPEVRAELEAIIERGRRRTILDDRSDDEILGYDERGIPS